MPDMWMDVDTALSEVPVNLMPLIDDITFKDIEDAVAYNAGGMALRWHFVTTGGAYTVTSVTPTTGGSYDWTDQGDSGIYTIEIPASGGASINNDTEGFGWFTGKATGVLPWRGPVIGFRAAALNDALIDGGDLLDVNTTQLGGTSVDTVSMPGQAAPSATPSLLTAIMYLYKAWRNKKTQTATEFNLFADDASTVDQKATVSDDGTTTTVGEVASGP